MGMEYITSVSLIKDHHNCLGAGEMATEEAEKRFIRMPSESIRLCAERIGIQTSTEVSNALVEDVSFRIRQIADVSTDSLLIIVHPAFVLRTLFALII